MNKQTYLRPETAVNILSHDSLCQLTTSDTPADPNIPIDSKSRAGEDEDFGDNLW